MKILKLGQLPEEKVYRGTCSNCNTEFECKAHEGKKLAGSYQDDYKGYLSVQCPVCNKIAYAYERDDGQRTNWAMRNMAHQMEAGVVER